MKRFVFSMQALLEARIAYEERAERRLADGIRVLQASREELVRVCELLACETAAIAGLSGRHTSRNELLAHVRYRHALEQMLHKQNEIVTRDEAAVVELRESLRAAIADRQSIEDVKKAERRQWLEENKRQEQKHLDELAVQRFLRLPKQNVLADAEQVTR